MGTRSLTRVFQGRTQIVNIYRQYDGYPSGHGKELAEFLALGPLVNGIGSPTMRVFNGPGDLAAQLVCHLKQGRNTEPKVGGIYIMAPSVKDAGQDFEYHVIVSDDEDQTLTVKVMSYGKKLFSGNLADFTKFCNDEEE